MSVNRVTTKIEKGIPIPANKRNKKYPWVDMEVGDSILTDSRAAVIYARHKFSSHEFVSRIVGDKFRVWRVK